MSFQVTLWIELLAAGLGGLQGALFAAGERHRRIDILGVIVIGLAVSLGGSLLRDILLNQPSVVIRKNWYLPVAGASAILGMLLQPLLARADPPIYGPMAMWTSGCCSCGVTVSIRPRTPIFRMGAQFPVLVFKAT
ncbi:trimeric intracellular cation channel family protein [Phytohabitans sp. LJ34]|uniref:trimeric intracellular cation channel family protein n=1 Tax=Phytohabitans sp. LJ34 TaxID=3452217 RepID=UPI003F8A5A77